MGESVLRRSRKNAVLVCALWAVYALAGAAGALLPELLADAVGALYFTRAMRALAGLSVLRLPMLTASVTVTAAVLRGPGR